MTHLNARRYVAAVLLATLSNSWTLAAYASEPNVLTEQQAREGWISLFDGQTLFGWQPTSAADWKVEQGALSVASGEPGFLMTTSEFADYELHVDFKPGEKTNSGVFLRTPLDPQDPARDCVELNIAPRDNPFPTGSLVGRKKYEGDLKKVDPNHGWHSFDIRAEGSKLTVWLDGRELYGLDDSDPPLRGRIGLQFREGPVAFRNIRLRPIGMKPLFNGKDLAGWSADGAMESKFEVVAQDPSGSLPSAGRAGEGGEAGTGADHPSLTLPVKGRGPEGHGELQLTNGPGYLETDARYGDFVLQFDTLVDGDDLNSGVFFRSIPGEKWNGYECQINNAMVDDDPTKPKDAGTGGIYRRVNARRIVARDHEWFTTTLVADGPHMAVWVDGQQVTDWTDERPPHANPRNGLCLDPGTIQIQGHDPTTKFRFRNMNIAELPEAARSE